MSNLSDLAAITKENFKMTDAVGGMIGSIADIAGAVGAVISIVSFAQSMLGGQSDLDDVKSAIQASFDALNEHERAADTIARLTNLDNQISIAQGVFDGLSADVAANLSPADRNDRLEKCAQALEALSNDAWFAPYDDQVYWSDFPLFTGFGDLVLGCGYCRGPESIAPKPDDAGNVFSYIYILPAYLYTLAIFLVEAIALDPDYLSNWGESVITPAANLLSNYHDKIVNEGFVSLLPIPFSNGRAESWDPLPPPVVLFGYDIAHAMRWFSAPPDDFTAPPLGLTPAFFPVDPSTPNDVYVAGISIEYGVVEKFSGDSQVGSYVIDSTKDFYRIDQSGKPQPGAESDLYQKFQLCVLNTRKELYRSSGLFSLWKTINSVRSILRIAPLSTNPGDWSLREIMNVLGKNGQNLSGQASLRAIRNFIAETPLNNDVPIGYWSGTYQGTRTLLHVTGEYLGTLTYRTATNG